MNIFICILLIINTVNCAIDCSKEHTDIYNECTDHKILFLNNTFGGYLKIDPCTPFKNREEFITTLAKYNIKCIGKWCSNNQGFSCLGKEECYHVEHIIDKQNSGNNCNKNIYGNIVMAYNKWNQQVGKLTWEHVKNEKSVVYGDIFNKAMQYVTQCDKSCKFEPNKNNLSDLDYNANLWIIISVLTAVIILLILIICISCCYFKEVCCFKNPYNSLDSFVDMDN